MDEMPGAEALEEPEFDITGGVEPDFILEMNDDDENGNAGAPVGESEDEEDETLIRDEGSVADAKPEPEDESEDETLMPGSMEMEGDQSNAESEKDEDIPEDETLMRGSFDANKDEDEDMTIRKESDEAVDDFFDIGDDDDYRK
jgi:hypothetical protein